MQKSDKILVAGGRGLVGSAIVRKLKEIGYQSIETPTSKDVDFSNQQATQSYLQKTKPQYVFIAAAKVGGILANSTYPAEFAYINMMIQNNLIHGSYEVKVKKLLFLGSSCIYPKDSPVPIKESALLTGPLEPTNEAYALAKISGVKMCDYYRKQYGCDFISGMPTNTFGPNDNYDLQTSHVLPALIHKFHIAKVNNQPSVQVWGTGKPLREILYSDDVADACVFLMDKYSDYGPINIGSGEDYSIRQIAEMIRDGVGYKGDLAFDASKPDGVYRKVMDVTRLKDLGWKSKISISDGIKKAYADFQQNYLKSSR